MNVKNPKSCNTDFLDPDSKNLSPILIGIMIE